MSDVEIKKNRNIGGNDILVIFGDGLNSNIKIPTSGRSSNLQEKQGQRGEAKARKPQVSVQRRDKKARK